MKFIHTAAALAALSLGMAAASASQGAILTSEFTVDGASGGLGVAAPYGEVVVNDAGGTLAFTVTLFDNLRFRNSPDLNHFSFAFDLGGLSGSIGSITDNGAGTFTSVPGPVNMSPFGSFQLALDCTSGCTTGYNAASPSVLSFVVTGAGALTIANLTTNGEGALFAADVVAPGGSTGNIGSTGLKTTVPEPASWAMMLLGFGGLGAVLRSRRRQAVVTA